MSRQATLVTADEATISLSGKMNIFGVYSTDITIPTETTVVTQLVFVFLVETDPDDIYQKLELRVDLPSGDFRHLPVNLTNLKATHADTIRWSLKYPLLFQNAILKPGPITAAVIHEKGIIYPASPFVVLRQTMPAQSPA
jgi:hypothetical protein